MRQMLLGLAAGLGLGLGLGLFAGMILLPPPVADVAGTSPTPCADTRPIVQAADCPAPDAEEILALRSLTTLLERQVDELETELYGEPYPWPADIPDALQPAAFEQNLRDAFAQCSVPVDIVGFRCEEPPCYALLRRDEKDYSASDPWMEALMSCTPWLDTFGADLSFATHTIQCPGERKEGFTMLAPSPDWLAEDGSESSRTLAQRFDIRLRAAKAAWPCALDGTIP